MNKTDLKIAIMLMAISTTGLIIGWLVLSFVSGTGKG